MAEMITAYASWAYRWPLVLKQLRWPTSRRLRVHIVLLEDAQGRPARNEDLARGIVHNASAILALHRVTLVEADYRPARIQHPRQLEVPAWSAWGAFQDERFWWFEHHSARDGVTIYFVEDVTGECGWAMPGTRWCVVDAQATSVVLSHEVCHLAFLGHSNDVGNLMHPSARLAHLEKWQGAMLRASGLTTSA